MENTLNDLVLYAIHHNGGTFNPDTLLPLEPKSGFAVSINGASEVHHTLDSVTVNGYLNSHSKELEGINRYFGLWKNNEGLWFYDASIIIENEGVAKNVAEEEEQIAYYDFARGTEVYIIGAPNVD